jgi:hypothetical protein
MSSLNTRTDLLAVGLAVGLAAVGTAATILYRRSPVKKYVDDPAHVGRLVSTPTAPNARTQENTPTYDIVIIGSCCSLHTPLLLPNIFLLQAEERLDVLWPPAFRRTQTLAFSYLKQEVGMYFFDRWLWLGLKHPPPAVPPAPRREFPPVLQNYSEMKLLFTTF